MGSVGVARGKDCISEEARAWSACSISELYFYNAGVLCEKETGGQMRLIPILAALALAMLSAAAADVPLPSRQPTMEDDVLMEYVNSSIKLYFVGRYKQSIVALRDVLKNHKAGEGDAATQKAHDFARINIHRWFLRRLV